MVFLNRGSATSSPQLSRNPSVTSAYNEKSMADNGMRSSSSCSTSPAIQDDSPQSPGPHNGFGFKFRSRSNTKGSMTLSLTTSVSAPHSSGSDLGSPYVADVDGRSSKSKSMFSRGRKAKRHSSKLSFGSVIDGMGELVQARPQSTKGSSARQSPVQDGTSPEGISTRGTVLQCRGTGSSHYTRY